MPLRSILGLALLAFLLLTAVGERSRAQFGGADPRNPDGMFNWYAKVQWSDDELHLDKIIGRMDPELAGKLKVYVARAGITNGKLTRAQFTDFWSREAAPLLEARLRAFAKANEAAQKAGILPQGNPGGGERDRPKPGYQPRPFREDEARNAFRQLDRDQSGDLDLPECRQSTIRREMERWDTNSNKLIDLDEFLAFQRDRHNERENDRKAEEEDRAEERRFLEEFRAFKKSKQPGATPPGPILPDRPGPRPAPPATLPLEFKELDTDEDGQIGLYEWRKAERDPDEFRKYDRNEDGLITPTEVQWYEKTTGGTPAAPPPAPGKGLDGRFPAPFKRP